MKALRLVLLQVLVLVVAGRLADRLAGLGRRLGARGYVYLMTVLSILTTFLGVMLCQLDGLWGALLGWMGWVALLVALPLDGLTIAMCMRLRPRAWPALALMLLSAYLLWSLGRI